MREHVDQDAVVATTQALVRVDTRNPPGDEARIIEVCRGLLTPLGAQVEVVEPSPGRTSVARPVPGKSVSLKHVMNNATRTRARV